MIIEGSSFNDTTRKIIETAFPDKFPLILCDPPYGGIVKEKWDVASYDKWMSLCAYFAQPTATIAMWGGIGKKGERHFLEFAALVEKFFPEWTIKNWITWKKKRAYGVVDNYLFTREECLILTRGKPTFNIPLLEEKRGYAGFGSKKFEGSIKGCYHSKKDGIYKKSSDLCLSSGAQASCEGHVQRLLRKKSLQYKSRTPQKSSQGLVAEKSGTSENIFEWLEEAEPVKGFTATVKEACEENRGRICIDGERFICDLDGYVPGVRNKIREREPKVQGCGAVHRQDRQFCWVCTLKHMHNVTSGESLEIGCEPGGIGSHSVVYESTEFEDINIYTTYKAKSEFLRRTNVWTDITELFRGKIHPTQKPDRLYEVLIETHSNPGDTVFDPCAGSLVTRRAAINTGRNYCCVELKAEYLKAAMAGETWPA